MQLSETPIKLLNRMQKDYKIEIPQALIRQEIARCSNNKAELYAMTK